MCPVRRQRERGQSTVEWIGLVLLVALIGLIVLAALAGRAQGLELARALASRILCAASLAGDACTEVSDPELVAEYGVELARTVRRVAPTIAYERGMRAVPVDFRSCREDPCSMGSSRGVAIASDHGEPVTLFVRVADCRGETPGDEPGLDCSGVRAGSLYLQYWAYYPGSQSLRALPGDIGHHDDDWESLQVRIGPGGREARASSHHGYNHRSGPGNWLSDAGIAPRDAWGEWGGRYHVSGGSHAGHAWEPRGPLARWTPGSAVRLIPVEAVARGPWADTSFEVTPPWRKRVYLDPEHRGTG